jgi:hypothetical protein
MTAFSSLLTDFRASAPNYEIEIDENWKQGRTAYGGLTAALLHAAIVNSYDNLPPLRTAQINFVGPTMAGCGLPIRHSDAAKTK